MSKFGWSLPPGCSQRDIEDSVGGDPRAEEFEIAFTDKILELEPLTDEDKLAQLVAWVWEQIGNSYQEGYKQGISDDRLAVDILSEKALAK